MGDIFHLFNYLKLRLQCFDENIIKTHNNIKAFYWKKKGIGKAVLKLTSSPNFFWIQWTKEGVFQLSSVAPSCPTLCDPMNHSTPGLTVHHQLPEFTQTHVHQVGDAVQPSHPLSSPSPPAPNPSQHQVFSNESALRIRWPKYWSFSFSISPSSEHPGLISLRTDWISWQSKGLSRFFSNTTVQKHQFFGAQLSSQSNSHIHTWPLEKS